MYPHVDKIIMAEEQDLQGNNMKKAPKEIWG
jgi:hypothetical protein